MIYDHTAKTLKLIIASLTNDIFPKYLNIYIHKKDFLQSPIYESKQLIITQVSKNTFQHTSFLHTKDFGVVPGNGLIVRSSNQAIIFDTPVNYESTDELIQWVESTLHCKIVAIIPTHYHPDCLGGLKAFHDKGIPSYAYFKTIELAKKNNFISPQNSFQDSLILKVGDQKITAKFLGEGHTSDNIVGYFPSENVMFGGCLIKEMGAKKGYLQDANISDWSTTVEKVKKEYPQVRIIVPGHGQVGDKKLLDYTIELFKKM
ncbi:MAG: subclass B1 metallo-beta-lactamase [Leptospiraceae bacterium]|nr:subclass B1 metallo-beta-lactamase [Leptospiraceae bacterium]NUM40857.1 subclass B1 metallo-beta-lactamase [Leptospiraceae bacterium]